MAHALLLGHPLVSPQHIVSQFVEPTFLPSRKSCHYTTIITQFGLKDILMENSSSLGQ